MERQKRDSALALVARTAGAYDPDPGHGEQVTRLALRLFDELLPLHNYGERERFLLEMAGRLHDIGWFKAGPGNHHKASAEMILSLEIPGLAEGELLVCALIARYHNKALPDPARHGPFSSLGQERRQAVLWLAGILRVADGLDCSHRAVIGEIACLIERERIVIGLDPRGDCSLEVGKATKKGNLLKKISARGIVYRC